MNNYYCFWQGWLSNFYPCKFKEDNVEFNCVEQYFMYKKALLFKDYGIAKEILYSSNPKEIKALGRKVKGYDDSIWSDVRYGIMKKGVTMKFSQNPELLRKLLGGEYDGKTFVEASPYDKIWGVGVGKDHGADNPTNWKGLNLLGQIITEVRQELNKR